VRIITVLSVEQPAVRMSTVLSAEQPAMRIITVLSAKQLRNYSPICDSANRLSVLQKVQSSLGFFPWGKGPGSDADANLD
jgi:hypothetical protein